MKGILQRYLTFWPQSHIRDGFTQKAALYRKQRQRHFTALSNVLAIEPHILLAIQMSRPRSYVSPTSQLSLCDTKSSTEALSSLTCQPFRPSFHSSPACLLPVLSIYFDRGSICRQCCQLFRPRLYLLLALSTIRHCTK